jgi:hypothetical protein
MALDTNWELCGVTMTRKSDQPNELPLPSSFYDLFSLFFLFRGSIRETGYRLDPSITAALHLSEYGMGKFNLLKRKFPKATESEVKQVLFLDLYHLEPYFDLERLNSAALVEGLNRDFQKGSLLLPWVFGAVLYRRANTLFPEIVDKLEPHETKALLQDTPKGVFQMRQFVTGPFGILRSTQNRCFFPIKKIHLWHCTDPECTNEHKASLSSGDSGLTDIRDALIQFNKHERYKNWDTPYADAREDADYYDLAYPASLIRLLGDAFSHREMQKIVATLLSRQGLQNASVPTAILKKLKGDPKKITETLGPDQCLQLALLCKDKIIIESIEKLILAKEIGIPPSETRTSGEREGWYHVVSQASSNGIRFLPGGEGMPATRLKGLLSKLYPDDNSKGLEWAVRFERGSDTLQKLESYVERESPENIIHKHVFASAESLERTFGYVGGAFEIPKNPDAEHALIDRIMWKLGFEAPHFPFNYADLDESALRLKHTVENSLSRWEENENNVRSAGSNYFVRLEEFLNDSLSFCTWALLSDHYKETKFDFNKRLAAQSLATELSKYRGTAGLDLVFDPNGKNTLGPLIIGYRILAEKCKAILAQRKKFGRAPSGYPAYAGHSIEFPFRHTKLLFDLTSESRDKILSQLVWASSKLDNASVAGTRNRLEHSRNKFPSPAELTATLEGASEVVSELLRLGLSASTYRVEARYQDKWGRPKTDYINYRGEIISVPARVSSLLSSIPCAPKYAIFAPSMQLEHSQEILRFTPTEDSDYAAMWQDYPIRQTKH